MTSPKRPPLWHSVFTGYLCLFSFICLCLQCTYCSLFTPNGYPFIVIDCHSSRQCNFNVFVVKSRQFLQTRQKINELLKHVIRRLLDSFTNKKEHSYYVFFSYQLDLGSSIASPICQEGQSERAFLIFFHFFKIFPLFLNSPLFFPISPSFSQI